MTRSGRTSLALILFLAIWEVTSRSGLVPRPLFPPPTDAVKALVGLTLSGELVRDVKASIWRAIVGLLCGSITGIAVGSLTGRIRAADDVLSPLIQLFRPLPPVAIIPLIIIWWGIGEASKLFSISFAVFFPVWISTYIGVQGVPNSYIWTARSLRVSGLMLWWRVILPSSLPILIAGLRNAVAVSFVMMFVSELAGASAGIGYQISVSQLAYRVDRMMAALIVLAASAATADHLLAVLIHRLFPWLSASVRR
jgi:ABC-type nitrate/sulfonate/bicarbonate transport system permease component